MIKLTPLFLVRKRKTLEPQMSKFQWKSNKQKKNSKEK